MKLMGLDLAWHSEKNPSAAAVGRLDNGVLSLEELEPALFGLGDILAFISNQPLLTGIAIDAPLIIENQTGQRECEKQLSRDYGSRKASCHTSNTTLYPAAASVDLSLALQDKGFGHLALAQWQIECYPHPAMIECFELPERLLYKKGEVATRKAGQIALASLITQLASSPVLALEVPESFSHILSEDYIESLSGQALKGNEDALDAIFCLYIAGLYQIKVPGITYGCDQQGYIWVPQVQCISWSPPSQEKYAQP
ncbi:MULTISPECIES: DUF429 domain-containing protein [unclassified Pseudoalteromonas]|uniref:DUF429 domain-containing protein n=1 Tax=unclassified Pseudoalteromonas TaxID=194690 RepID=UPI0020977FA3|nr:DUF429 domain-containing protein [Pseudoalteromonas sp. XMcav2-N]MCO7187434.1 DUF429 domain-containing protein [Pseudoalteromonas sp. XMcav2-N]